MEYLGRGAFEDKDLVKDFATKLCQDDIKDLNKASKGYPIWTQDRVTEIINEIY